MSVCFGEYLNIELKKICHKFADHAPEEAEEPYRMGIKLKNGDGMERNLREAFHKFKEASRIGHIEATRELAECYLYGRGCERDIKMAAELGNPNAALELGMKSEIEWKESECVRYLWMASDLGKEEATIRLAEIYQNGNRVNRDEEESKKMFRIGMEGVVYQQAKGFECGIHQSAKILFIKGANIDRNGELTMPWDKHKGLIRSIVILGGTGVIRESVFQGLVELERVSIPSSVNAIRSNLFVDCTKLDQIEVSESNPKYTTVDGVLFTKDKTVLVACPSSKSGKYKVPMGVVEIGEKAFFGCTLLENVTLPCSVRRVGASAFEKCSGLDLVKINGELEVVMQRAFYNCRNLSAISFDRIEQIREDAFKNTSIRREFYLEGLNLDDAEEVAGFVERTAIDDQERIMLWREISRNCLEGTISSTWETDGEIEWRFDENKGRLIIKGKGPLVTYADGNKSCRMRKYNCWTKDECSPWSKKYREEIRSVVVCYGVSEIGHDAFVNCTSLRSVIIPEGVISIGNCAFRGCKVLSKIFIPESVKSICVNPFIECEQLRSITIASGNQHYVVVNNVLFDKGITCLKSYTAYTSSAYEVPNTVTSIDGVAFNGCTGLASIIIPDSVKNIGGYAFEACSSLSSITIPRSVTSIGKCAFLSCSGLTSVSIPSSVTSIGEYAFHNCSKLKTVFVPKGLKYPSNAFPEGAATKLY